MATVPQLKLRWLIGVFVIALSEVSFAQEQPAIYLEKLQPSTGTYVQIGVAVPVDPNGLLLTAGHLFSDWPVGPIGWKDLYRLMHKPTTGDARYYGIDSVVAKGSLVAGGSHHTDDWAVVQMRLPEYTAFKFVDMSVHQAAEDVKVVGSSVRPLLWDSVGNDELNSRELIQRGFSPFRVGCNDEFPASLSLAQYRHGDSGSPVIGRVGASGNSFLIGTTSRFLVLEELLGYLVDAVDGTGFDRGDWAILESRLQILFSAIPEDSTLYGRMQEFVDTLRDAQGDGDKRASASQRLRAYKEAIEASQIVMITPAHCVINLFIENAQLTDEVFYLEGYIENRPHISDVYHLVLEACSEEELFSPSFNRLALKLEQIQVQDVYVGLFGLSFLFSASSWHSDCQQPDVLGFLASTVEMMLQEYESPRVGLVQRLEKNPERIASSIFSQRSKEIRANASTYVLESAAPFGVTYNSVFNVRSAYASSEPQDAALSLMGWRSLLQLVQGDSEWDSDSPVSMTALASARRLQQQSAHRFAIAEYLEARPESFQAISSEVFSRLGMSDQILALEVLRTGLEWDSARGIEPSEGILAAYEEVNSDLWSDLVESDDVSSTAWAEVSDYGSRDADLRIVGDAASVIRDLGVHGAPELLPQVTVIDNGAGPIGMAVGPRGGVWTHGGLIGPQSSK